MSPTPRDIPSRRLLLGAAGLLPTAACGRERPAPATEGEGGFPVTIRHKYGSTEIPSGSKRIVMIGPTEQD